MLLGLKYEYIFFMPFITEIPNSKIRCPFFFGFYSNYLMLDDYESRLNAAFFYEGEAMYDEESTFGQKSIETERENLYSANRA